MRHLGKQHRLEPLIQTEPFIVYPEFVFRVSETFEDEVEERDVGVEAELEVLFEGGAVPGDVFFGWPDVGASEHSLPVTDVDQHRRSLGESHGTRGTHQSGMDSSFGSFADNSIPASKFSR